MRDLLRYEAPACVCIRSSGLAAIRVAAPPATYAAGGAVGRAGGLVLDRGQERCAEAAPRVRGQEAGGEGGIERGDAQTRDVRARADLQQVALHLSAGGG